MFLVGLRLPLIVSLFLALIITSFSPILKLFLISEGITICPFELSLVIAISIILITM